VTHTVKQLLAGGHFFESARWHHERWWVSDFFGGAVYSITPDGQVTTELEVPSWPSGLGWLPDDSLLVVSITDRQVIRRASDGSVTVHADISHYCEGWANDMVVTPEGHAYVGNLGYDWDAEQPQNATIVHVAPDGTVDQATSEIAFPNGASILSDGVTLVVADTFEAQAVAWTVRPDGSLMDRRIWADLGSAIQLSEDGQIVTPPAVAPDGCAVDRHDRIWMADGVGRRVLLVAEGGEVLDEISAPDGLSAYACALGGDDHKTLLICAAPDHLPAARQAVKESVIYTVDL
jgi:sugar lactone lactonase YvrE